MVGFEFTTYSVDEDDGMVEVAVVVTEPFGGAPQPFSLSLSTKDGTACEFLPSIQLNTHSNNNVFFNCS